MEVNQKEPPKTSGNGVNIPVEYEYEKNMNLDINSEFSKVINFHIFVPPEFKIDPNTCQIGIYSNLCDWKENKAVLGKFIRLGFKYLCLISFNIDSKYMY